MFADPDFDGDPALVTEEDLTASGEVTAVTETPPQEDAPTGETEPGSTESGDTARRKFYFDGGQVEIVAHLVYDIDPNGKQLRVVRYDDYAAETVRTSVSHRAKVAGAVGGPGEAVRDHRQVGRARHQLR